MQMQRENLRLKKYSNRRLYDLDGRRYVTLDELARRVQSGANVTVSDAKTGADITQPTLAQVMLESRGGSRLLPVPLLVRLLRMRDEALEDFLGRYVVWAHEVYEKGDGEQSEAEKALGVTDQADVDALRSELAELKRNLEHTRS